MEEVIQIFTKMLEIIGYKGDKNKHVGELLQIISNETVLEILELLPKEQAKHMEQEISKEKNLQNISSIVGRYINRDDYIEKFSSIAKRIQREYVDKITTSLTKEQREKIELLLSSTTL